MYAFILFLLLVKLTANAKFLTYEEARNAVIEAEDLLATGGRIALSPKEKAVNKMLLKYKTAEIQKGIEDTGSYAPGMHFFKAKELIEQSTVFKFLKKMPKGALLHAHNSAMVSSEWFIQNLTYYDGMLKCTNQKGVVILTFRQASEHGCNSYIRISEERLRSPDAQNYDKELEKLINLYTPTPETDYPHISTVWSRFQNMFVTTSDVIRYMPAFKAYHRRVLEEMYEDGIIYIEFRASFGYGYDDTNKSYSVIDLAQELKKIVDEFSYTHANFIGAKVIYTTARMGDSTFLKNRLKIYSDLRKALPNFIVGFDLVGQEDLGKSLHEILPILKSVSDDTEFFFHAGETNWYGTSIDFNILDAILLNTTRIGHGYGILKHPVLWNAAKKRGIPIEINPISNQVLHLVWDLRNHPAAFLMSEDVPIVISNDDPGFWNAKGVSYDFYYAFMCFTAENAGLQTLIELVWNSIKYSFLTQSEQERATSVFQKIWDSFLDNVLAGKVV